MSWSLRSGLTRSSQSLKTYFYPPSHSSCLPACLVFDYKNKCNILLKYSNYTEVQKPKCCKNQLQDCCVSNCIGNRSVLLFFFFKSRNRNTKRYIRFIHNSTTWRYWLSDFQVNLCLPFDPASGALLLQPWLLASSPSSNSPTIQDFDSRDHCQTHTAQHKPVQPSAQDVPRSFVCKSFGPVGRAGVQVLALH